MNNYQEYSPKYWAAHDTTNDDIYIVTMAKSYSDARELYNEHYGVYPEDAENVKINLIELKLVRTLD